MQREEERDNGFKSSDKLSARAERRNEGVYQNSFNSMTSDKTVTNLDLTTKNNNIMKDIQNCTGKCVCVEGVGRREKYQQQKLGKIKESNGEYWMKRKTKLSMNE